MTVEDNNGDSTKPARQLKRAEDNVYYKLALKGRDVWNRWMAEVLSAREIKKLNLGHIKPLIPEEKAQLAVELGMRELLDPRQVDFSDTEFADEVNFEGFIFRRVKFTRARFTGFAFFDFATFAGDAVFSGARFTDDAWFEGATFTGDAWFNGTTFRSSAWFAGTTAFEGKADFSGDSVFGGDVDFSGRTFKNSTTFRRRRFKRAPKFHNATFHQDTDFGVTDFNPIFSQARNVSADHWESTARAFRTLALAMNKAHAHEEEVRFFALEMRAKERYETGARKWLITLYRWFGDYGQSIARPALWLARAYALAFVINLALSKTLPACVAPSVVAECDRWAQLGQALAFTATSSVPFLGQARMAADMADKLFDPVMLPWVYAVSVVQGLASVVFIFLMGLALRNRFRIK